MRFREDAGDDIVEEGANAEDGDADDELKGEEGEVLRDGAPGPAAVWVVAGVAVAALEEEEDDDDEEEEDDDDDKEDAEEEEDAEDVCVG